MPNLFVEQKQNYRCLFLKNALENRSNSMQLGMKFFNKLSKSTKLSFETSFYSKRERLYSIWSLYKQLKIKKIID